MTPRCGATTCGSWTPRRRDRLIYRSCLLSERPSEQARQPGLSAQRSLPLAASDHGAEIVLISDSVWFHVTRAATQCQAAWEHPELLWWTRAQMSYKTQDSGCVPASAGSGSDRGKKMTSEHPQSAADADSGSKAQRDEGKSVGPKSEEKNGSAKRIIAFFDSTTKVLVAVGGLIAAIAALWTGIAHFTSSSTPGPGANITAQSATQAAAMHIDKCESQHQLNQQRQTLDITVATTAFDSCMWPAPSYADADGFTQITFQTVAGPGADEASDSDWVDRITGPCNKFTLAYDFGSQGALEHLAPFTIPVGLITSIDQPGTAWPGGVKSLSFYPARDEVDVMHNSNDELSGASCRA